MSIKSAVIVVGLPFIETGLCVEECEVNGMVFVSPYPDAPLGDRLVGYIAHNSGEYDYSIMEIESISAHIDDLRAKFTMNAGVEPLTYLSMMTGDQCTHLN